MTDQLKIRSSDNHIEFRNIKYKTMPIVITDVEDHKKVLTTLASLIFDWYSN